MTTQELLENLSPVYAFNALIRYYPDDALVYAPSILAEGVKGKLIQSLMLEESELRLRTSELIRSNPDAYFEALSITEFAKKESFAAVRKCDRYDFLNPLLSHAEKEGIDESIKYGYVINSSALPLARNTTALFSPTGRPLGIYKTPSEKTDAPKTSDPLEIPDLVSMKYGLAENPHWTQAENTAATMLMFWHRLPQEWQSYLLTLYDTFGVDLEGFIRSSPNSFELAANFSGDIAGLMARDDQFIRFLPRYVDAKLQSILKTKEYPEEIDPNEFLILMNSEYSQTNFSEQSIEKVFDDINFDSIRFLRKNLGIDFTDISRREFFALIGYLKKHTGGEGFARINDFVSKAQNKQERIARIRSFLSLDFEHGWSEQELFMFDANLSPETTHAIFNRYAELVDAAKDASAYIAANIEPSAFQGMKQQKIVTDYQKSILYFGQRLLATCAEKLKKNPGIGRDVTEQAILEHIDTIRKQTVSLLTVAKTLKKADPDVKLHEVLSALEFRSMAGDALSTDLSDEDISAMERIYMRNYPREKASFREGLLSSLREKLSNKGTELEIFRSMGELSAFCTFQDKGDHIYFGAFNVDPEMQNSPLRFGAKIMEILDQKAAKNIIRGDSIPTNPISTYYLNRKNFVAKKAHIWNGKLLLGLERDDSSPRSAAKSIPEKDIIAYADRTKLVPDTLSSITFSRVDSEEYKKLIEEAESSKNANLAFPFLREGFVLTRLCFQPEEKRVYLAYEKTSENNTHSMV